jgi:hypothetical protein
LIRDALSRLQFVLNRGKGLQLEFTVEDAGVFTMSWSATITYGRNATQHGRSASAPRMCSTTIRTTTSLTRTRIFRRPTSRISDRGGPRTGFGGDCAYRGAFIWRSSC